MPVLGIDVGSATAKAVILKDAKILSNTVIPTGFDVSKTVNEVTGLTCKKIGASLDDIGFTVATGYARDSVPFANKKITEITCHAKGVFFLFPQTRTIIDIGGQDSKVIRINELGKVITFSMNDKCAAGTGRFLEVMARIFELEISEIGYLATQSNDHCPISSTCTVFAETEVIALRAQGKKREDIIAGIHKGMVLRIISMVKMLGYEEPIVLTGGVAKNIGVKHFLERELNIKVMIPEEPQITGALGAALFAESELDRK
jgi:predicted CoA-substrate-specific enzyme activase